MKRCWWCKGILTSVNVPVTLTGLQTREVNVHLGAQARDDNGRPVCIPPAWAVFT